MKFYLIEFLFLFCNGIKNVIEKGIFIVVNMINISMIQFYIVLKRELCWIVQVCSGVLG